MSNEDIKKQSINLNKLKSNLPIILILLLSTFLNMWRIWGTGFANKYYAAGVYSMGQNLHAFFFNSLDSIGFVTIDKPPLGFWIQVLFTKVFGFSGAILILPEAIASVVCVFLIYRIIKKRFSNSAGLIAAAILALTPIFVAVSRNNTIDGILILLLVLAGNQALLATEKASMKHLILAGVFIGLGFNVKMLQAYMIVPAIYLTYLIFAKQKFIKKILVCAVSVIIMVVISLSWVVAVDMVPEENRPYIGSSDENSAVDLAIGYNGISRIINQRVLNGGGLPSTREPLPNNANDTNNINNKRPNRRNNQLPPNQQLNPVDNVKAIRAPGGESGESGIFRLYNEQNAGQISWFILPSIFTCLLLIVLVFRRKFKSNPKNIALLFFALCFIPVFIYFSFSSGISHRYYFATLAPFIAGLTAIGFYHLNEGKKYWFPIIFIPLAFAQLYIQNLYKEWLDWFTLIYWIIFVLAAAMIIAAVMKAKRKFFSVLLCTLLILPAVWSATPMIYNDNSQLPIAGPVLVQQNDKFDRELDLSGLIEYLEEMRGEATYLAVTASSMDMGAELILQSGEPVMVLGGFNGGDSILTLDEFIEAVQNNEVRYAIIGDSNRNSNIEIYQWIKSNATIIRPKEYGGIRGNLMVYELN